MSQKDQLTPYRMHEVDADGHTEKSRARIAELEAEICRIKSVIRETAHMASTLGSGSEGWMRGRFMTIANTLNAAIGRPQSSHGEQF